MGKKALIFAGVIFVGGLIYFNGQVADACTHGNCVHGWSSKYTQAEQNNSRMWFIGFPLFVFLLYQFINRNEETKINFTNSSDKKNQNIKQTKQVSQSLDKPTALRRVRNLLHGETVQDKFGYISGRALVKSGKEQEHGLILNLDKNYKWRVDRELSIKEFNLSADELEERIKKMEDIEKDIEKKEEARAKEEAIRKKEEPRIIEREYEKLVSAIQNQPRKQHIKLKKFYKINEMITHSPKIISIFLPNISGQRLKEYEVDPPLYYKKEALEKYTNYNFKKLLHRKYNKGMKSLFHD